MPAALRGLPEDPEEAFVEVLKRMGPCTAFDMKQALRKRYSPALWLKLVRQQRVVIVKDSPRTFDLSEEVLRGMNIRVDK